MTTISYNGNIPNPPNAPSADVNTMQANARAISQWVDIDHEGFNNILGGWHKIIHIPQIAGNTDPAPVTSPANAGQLYTKTIAGDLELFYESSGGIISQLTAPSITPLPAINGYSYLPGGIIVQWGLKTSTGGVQTVTLPFTFPNNFYNAQATMIRNINNIDVIYCVTPPKAVSTSTIQFRDTSSGNSFYWYAIGN